jgi:hypothetical protein
VNWSLFASNVKEVGIGQPAIETIPKGDLVTSSCDLIDFDLMKAIVDDLLINCEFAVRTFSCCELNGFVVGLDVHVDGPDASSALSTSPFAEHKHWK